MSLNIDLICRCGNSCCQGNVYSANITHNLTDMANAAGLYEALWRPEELACVTAQQIVPLLTVGLGILLDEPTKMRKLNPANGWGRYETLLSLTQQYLAACLLYPEAKVSVSR